MAKELDRVRTQSALAVIKQHPVMVLFAVSPAIAVAAVIWALGSPGWAIFTLLVLLGAGAFLVVRKR
jgi:hypothetical protein